MTRLLRISSYRLAFWHASKRARHDDLDVLDCVFCQYSEGVARMRDVAGYLYRRGFTIADSDDRSLTIAIEEPADPSDKIRSHSKADLLRIISGQPSFPLHTSRLE